MPAASARNVQLWKDVAASFGAEALACLCPAHRLADESGWQGACTARRGCVCEKCLPSAPPPRPPAAAAMWCRPAVHSHNFSSADWEQQCLVATVPIGKLGLPIIMAGELHCSPEVRRTSHAGWRLVKRSIWAAVRPSCCINSTCSDRKACKLVMHLPVSTCRHCFPPGNQCQQLDCFSGLIASLSVQLLTRNSKSHSPSAATPGLGWPTALQGGHAAPPPGAPLAPPLLSASRRPAALGLH